MLHCLWEHRCQPGKLCFKQFLVFVFPGQDHAFETNTLHGIPNRMLSLYITGKGQPGHSRPSSD